MLSTPNISFTVASRPKQNPHQPMALLHIPERGSEEVHILWINFYHNLAPKWQRIEEIVV
jgi:hypothetical protein